MEMMRCALLLTFAALICLEQVNGRKGDDIPEIKNRFLIVVGKDQDAIATYKGPNRVGPRIWATPLDTEQAFKDINEDFNQNFAYPYIIEYWLTEVPLFKDIVTFSKDGYQCDDDFCEEFGNGMFGMGMCTQYYCKCSKHGAEEGECEDLLAYDPVRKTCKPPPKVEVCKV